MDSTATGLAAGSGGASGPRLAWLYAAAALLVGAAVMALEMVASRFLTPVFGGSIITWAALIAVVMVALAAGYLAGGRLADRWPQPEWAGLVLGVAAIYVLLGARHGYGWVAMVGTAVDDVRWGGLLGAVVLTFVPAGLLATYAPWALRLSVRAAGHAGRVSGRLYGVSTLGSVAGTLVTAFVLVPNLGSVAIMHWLAWFVLVTALALVAAALAPAGAGRRGRALWLGGLVAAAFVALWTGDEAPVAAARTAGPPAAGGAAQPPAAAPGDGIVEHVESLYSDIYVVREGDYLSLRFARDSRFYSETRIHRNDPGELPLIYNRLMLAGLAYPEHLESLLMLGLGGGGMTRFLRVYTPELALTGVELDAAVIDLGRRYFELDDGVEVVHDDGRLYLQGSDQRFDVVVVDTYRGGTVPFHMVTREFFELARHHLTPGGCLIVNLHAGSRLIGSILRTLGAVFDQVDTFRSPRSGNVIAVAHDGALDAAALGARATARQQRYAFPYHLRSLLEYRQQSEVDTSARVLVDDFAPAAYLAAIQAHNRRLTPALQGARPRIDALPLGEIAVDGDLSDWPANQVEYPVLVNGKAYGATDIDDADLRTSPDLSARFMVGWDPAADLIYLALRVRDETLVGDGQDPWSSDACEIYLAADPEAPAFTGSARGAIAADLPVLQYVAVPGPGAYGEGEDNPGLSRGHIAATRSHAAWRRGDGVTVYEWALQVLEGKPLRGVDLNPGDVYGFDVVVVDKDADDGPPAWIHWGPARPRKYADPGALGTVRLVGPQ